MARRVLDILDQPKQREGLRRAYGIHTSLGQAKDVSFSARDRAALLGGIRRSISARQLDEQVRILSLSVTGYDAEMAAAIADTVAEVYIQMNHELGMESFQKSFSMISKSLAEVRERIKTGEIAIQKTESELKLLEALKLFGDKYPEVVRLRDQIPQFAKELEVGARNLAETELGRHQDLIPLLLESHTDLDSLSAIESDLSHLKPILMQERETTRQMYNTIFQRLQEVQLASSGSVWVDAEVIEPAAVPGSPIRPNKKMNLLIGVITGLCIGIGLAFFQEYMDNSIRSVEDIQNYLQLFPLGMVPHVEFDNAGGDNDKTEKEQGHPQSLYWNVHDPTVPLYIGEAYRIIRTNLAFGSVDTSLKLLQVTSAVKGEGKTTTTANLGISLALSGLRVLLVDADLRRPSLHRVLNLEGTEHGLHDAVMNGRPLESLLEQTTVPNLFCMVAGAIPPNPAEILGSKRMKSLLDEFRAGFDMVLFDSPPVMSVADATILASRVDGTILVARSGYLPKHLFLQAKKAITAVNGKIVGCILNNVMTENLPYYYSQYGYKTGYYDYEEEGKRSEKRGHAHVPMTQMERLKLLKEAALSFLAAQWQRVSGFSKGGRTNGTKSSEDSRASDGHS